MSSLRRIQRELADLERNPLTHATGGPAGDDLRNWTIMLSGPSDTPYEGGVFSIELKLPAEYPFKAPQARVLGVARFQPSICAGQILDEDLSPKHQNRNGRNLQ